MDDAEMKKILNARVRAKFGRLFKIERNRIKMSRASMAKILHISPKTIQSWETGRTFIEDLHLITIMHNGLGMDICPLLKSATA